MISSIRQPLQAGERPGHGRFACTECGTSVSLETADDLPGCPECGATSYQRASIFESSPEAQPGGTVEFTPAHRTGPPEDAGAPDWLEDLRAGLDPGRYLAVEDGEVRVHALQRGWTRVGRSAVADVRLDDPSVSRRHALVVWEDDQPLRVLDDRSLNGIYINSEPADWGELSDGDELAVGRFRLYGLFVD